MHGGDAMTEMHISNLKRLTLLPGKLRERGLRWFTRRVIEIAGGCAHRVSRWGAQATNRLVMALLPFARSFTKDTFVSYYDLEVYPISYDICWFLVWADLERQRRQLSHLHCVFLPIEDHYNRTYPPGYDEVVDLTSRRWRFQNICTSMVSLLPAGEGFTVCNTRAQAQALDLLVPKRWPNVNMLNNPPLSQIYRDIAARLCSSGPDWGLKAPEQGLRYIRTWLDCRAGERKPVVVTLRQYAVDSARNSNTADWISFLKGLDQDEYFPVLVPDTDHALESNWDIEGLTLCNEAAWNLGLRMSLYESAYLNMFVNSGPASLCILNSRCRYLLFKITVPGIHLASEATLREMGFETGTTPAFATRYQRWVWDIDRVDVINAAFEAMVDRIEGTKQRRPEVAALSN
jgi:hypothetical protein